MPSITGPKAKKPAMARIMPRMPAEKLFTSISKPARILPSQSLSICLVIQAASGPMIIAPEEHRDVRADDDAHSGDRGHDAAALAVDHAAAGVGDEERQQVGDHGAHETDVPLEGAAVALGQRRHSARPADESGVTAAADDLGDRCPVPPEGALRAEEPGGDEEHRDEAPGDEGRDVRHDHAGEERAEPLHPDSEATFFGAAVDVVVMMSSLSAVRGGP